MAQSNRMKKKAAKFGITKVKKQTKKYKSCSTMYVHINTKCISFNAIHVKPHGVLTTVASMLASRLSYSAASKIECCYYLQNTKAFLYYV